MTASARCEIFDSEAAALSAAVGWADENQADAAVWIFCDAIHNPTKVVIANCNLGSGLREQKYH